MARGHSGADYRVVDRGPDHVVVELWGELGRAVHPEWLKEALEDHFVDDGVRVIRVDLSGVSYLDGQGVSILVALLKEAGRRGKRFTVERVHDQALAKLRETGVAGILGAEGPSPWADDPRP
jgi:anti-anti-sigma factor